MFSGEAYINFQTFPASRVLWWTWSVVPVLAKTKLWNKSGSNLHHRVVLFLIALRTRFLWMMVNIFCIISATSWKLLLLVPVGLIWKFHCRLWWSTLCCTSSTFLRSWEIILGSVSQLAEKSAFLAVKNLVYLTGVKLVTNLTASYHYSLCNTTKRGKLVPDLSSKVS